MEILRLGSKQGQVSNWSKHRQTLNALSSSRALITNPTKGSILSKTKRVLVSEESNDSYKPIKEGAKELYDDIFGDRLIDKKLYSM